MSKIAIVGCDASGKTVLISALSDYYQAGARTDQACIMVPSDAITRRYTDTLHRIMRIDRNWPAATSDIAGDSTLKWRLLRNGRTLADMEMMDFGGENFRYAFRDDGSDTNADIVKRLKKYISGADFVVITVSMDKMLRNLQPTIYRELERGDIEYDRDSEAQWVTGCLLGTMPDKLRMNPPAVVVALTQADKHQKELKEFGGAKGLFAKCWPEVAGMYPNLNVVPCASIDRVSPDGRPADGYSTQGVLAVMKEFVRYSFGDCDEVCHRLDELRKKLEELDEETASQQFVSTLGDYRSAYDALCDQTAVVSALFANVLTNYSSFVDGLAQREEKARAAEEARLKEEARLREEQSRAQVEHLKQKAIEEQRRQDMRLKNEMLKRRMALFRMILKTSGAVLFAAAIGVGAVFVWRYIDRRLQDRDRIAQEAQVKARADEALRQARAEAEKAAHEKRIREIELEKARMEKERAETKQKTEAETERARADAKASEAARAKAEREKAIADNERTQAAKAKAEAEKAKAEADRARAEADRAKAEAEKAKVEAAARQQTEARKKVEAETTAKLKANAEALRTRAEERENRYQEIRTRQNLERETRESEAFTESLTDAINRGWLKPGRNLIAELSGRSLTTVQSNRVAYARNFLDHLERAQNGNNTDMVWIGNQYYNSVDTMGVVKNPTEAYRWYQKAASEKNAQAYYYLSLMTEQGMGCQRDEALAGRYCLKSARLGYPEAMFWTGLYFMKGSHDFPQSLATAYKFLKMAKESGFKDNHLDDTLRSVRDARDGELIDSWFPDDPERPYIRPAKKESSWWGDLWGN